MKRANQPIQYHHYAPDRWNHVYAEAIVEAPVALTVNGDIWLTFMCTPVELEALAVGFLFNEGLIKTAEDVASVRLCASGDNIDVWLHHTLDKPERWRRTSGCTGGVTSVETNQAVQQISNGGVIMAGKVGYLIELLFKSQQLYKTSGGVHTTALSDGQNIAVAAEDIGRHNTLDKIAGHCLLSKITLSRRIILTTGRISSEMLQKSARIGSSIVISRTAPSSLSIEMAEKWGITLIGYARRNRFNVYTYPERIVLSKKHIKPNQAPITR